ncbi:TrbI/VirB10 family protein [Fusobacterium sp. FSA-380-WT-2B]|uniref:TrbI/VirB10 family protein n=1 Tax=Fusobacterium sp. FSA-380-WT-2B TaxID=2605786 RepID=UPI0012B23330|nr:TrbI/VirB10 family protein [Fusobacterium sp. FSA-380-WT-2B]MSS61492.1 TrbI/VirB10 family protein [Fusobacterium sp. FSA-380-WT-2B]
MEEERKDTSRIEEDIAKKEKPKVPSNIKVKVVLIIISVLAIIFIYGFLKGAETPKKVVEKPQAPEVDLNLTGTGNKEVINFPTSYEKRKTENSEIEEFNFNELPPSFENKNEQNIPVEKKINPLLNEYYSTLYQEELNARKSEISFYKKDGSIPSSEVVGGKNSQDTGIIIDDDLNKQKDKKNFFKNEEKRKIYNSGRELYSISPYEVKAGTYIPGVLISGINSDLPGNIKGQVREDVYDTVTGNHLLIPKGTTLIGTYDSGITFGQNRALVVWQRLIFPNGKTMLLDNMGGVDLSGYAGFKDRVDNHNLELFKAVILSSILGAGTAIVSDDDNKENDWRGEAGRGAGEQVIMIGNRLADKLLALQPTITIRPGYRFNIMTHSDLILTPYE